jgi:uncharacterized protein (TIGR03435 family)
MTRTALKLLLSVAVCWVLLGQKFEVAAIKPSAPGISPNVGCGPPFGSQLSPLQVALLNCTVHDLVGRAWSLRKYELSVPAEPAWISTARYDILAKSASPVLPSDHTRMLQLLLEDRFKLKWHREKKQLPVYYLTAAKGGLKLSATKPGSCTAWDHKGPPPPPYPGKPPTCDYILMPATPDRLGWGLDGTGVLVAAFASRLTDILGRPVVDQSAFTGMFDLHIKFASDSSLTLGGPMGQPDQANELSGLPNIFTAIRSLGLNIESGKGPVDVFVIDSVQRPSEN